MFCRCMFMFLKVGMQGILHARQEFYHESTLVLQYSSTLVLQYFNNLPELQLWIRRYFKNKKKIAVLCSSCLNFFFIFLVFKIILKNYLCVYGGAVCVYMNARAHWSQKRTLDLVELELQTILNHSRWPGTSCSPEAQQALLATITPCFNLFCFFKWKVCIHLDYYCLVYLIIFLCMFQRFF